MSEVLPFKETDSTKLTISFGVSSLNCLDTKFQQQENCGIQQPR
jgi:hypothetical protein